MNDRVKTELLEQAAAALIVVKDGQPVTTTLAIATGTGTTHEAVIKLVRTYSADLEEFGLVRFEIAARSQGQHGGGDTEYAVLNEEQASLVMSYMRNSEIVRQFKKALIRGFFDMRARLRAPALPNFADPAAAARAWADEVEAKQALAGKAAQLEHQVAAQAPAVAGFDLIANADGTMCMRDAAKVLQMRPHKLTDFLLLNEWIYHRTGKPGYIAYQDKLVTGYLQHKLGNYEDPDSGERKVNEQVRITKKGLTKLASMIAAPAARDSPPPGGQQPLI